MDRMSASSEPVPAPVAAVPGPASCAPSRSTAAPERPTKTGMLTGSAFVRRTRHAPTVDGGSAGRWVAAYESGWNGEALFQGAEPYMTIGSVAIDDATATEVVASLRRDARLQQAAELKFAHFAGGGRLNTHRLGVLASALEPGGALADRSSVYVVDKRYFVAGKIIDLLLEEYVNDHGGNLRAGDGARRAAWTLFNDGPRALGRPLFDELIGRFTDFAGLRNRGQVQVTVAEFFRMLDRAERCSTRKSVTGLLRALLRCRAQADDLQQRMSDPMFVATMEPLTPSIPAVLDVWARRLGPVSLLVDAHRELTDDHLDLIWQAMTAPHPDFRFIWTGPRPRDLARGTSKIHPSIQLADLVAGAARAVALFHEGLAGTAAQAGEILAPAVVPLIAAEGLFAHDEPERFATRKTSGS
jgi:hypothetical protein